MKSTTILSMFSLTVLAVALSACGGGGSSSSAPPLQKVTNPTTPIAPSTIVTSVPAATYAANSFNAQLYTQLNAMRLGVGSGLLTQNADLDKSSLAHWTYLSVNGLVDPSFHVETVGQTDFYGALVSDRATASGYVFSSIGEVGASTLAAGAEVNCVNQWSDSVYHMVAILGSQRDVGFAAADSALPSSPSITAATCVSDFGTQASVKPQVPSPGTVLAYPYNGQTNVPTGFNNQAEAPIPVSDLSGVGQPIGINMNEPVLSVLSFTLSIGTTPVTTTRVIGNPATTGVVTPDANVASGYVYLIPTAALLPNTTYTVYANVSVASLPMPVDKTWTFTTGPVASY